MITFSNRAGVSGGSELIADTNARTGEQICAFYVREDTVVSVATGNGKNYVTIFGISGKTLKAGDWFYVPYFEYITAITLTSGSIIAYQEKNI
jgi:hypothetical protein